ncbi:LD-carboxypeptidase [Sedimentibacter sp.]|uniref:S66 peptidase family protein n=1 Tax=Sedimentibacter sp. TaxID=1960295 RepID=UPI00289BDDAB|nr:LD-carboxypeptidase [Sedimentibacter sp.]
MIKPKKLNMGDKVAVVAPSSATDLKSVGNGELKLKSLGLNPVMFPTCYTNYGHLSASDEERAKDINDSFRDESIKGIICLRGGYGTPRILNMLDYEMIKKNPKVFMGFSDITALHTAFNQLCGMITFHGPMATSNYAEIKDGNVSFEPYTHDSLVKNIFTNEPVGLYANPPGEELITYNAGTAEGIIAGGNLMLLVSTLGSKYEIDTRGKILFIEEIDEPIYAIDRMLTSLSLAGKFKDCGAVIFGTFTNCKREQKAYEGGLDLTLEEVINNTVVPFNKPVIGNFRAGHNFPQPTIPLGTYVKLDAYNNKIIFTESGTV